MENGLITIERFLLDRQPEHATGDLTTLFYDIALAAKLIATQTRRAGLIDILGYEGTTNVQGERQKNWMCMPIISFINSTTTQDDCAPWFRKSAMIGCLSLENIKRGTMFWFLIRWMAQATLTRM